MANPQPPPLANPQPPPPPPPLRRICCLGVERIGTVTMMAMALMCPNVRIRIVDFNHNLLVRAHNGEFDFWEPQLDILRNLVLGLNPPRFQFHPNMAQSIQDADVIFLATAMKPKTKPLAKKGEPDWTEWSNAWKFLVYNVPAPLLLQKVIVDITTLPLDFERLLQCAISPFNPNNYQIVLNPSFVSEGNAIHDILNPTKIVIASRNPLAREVILHLYNQWVPPLHILVTQNLGSALLGKLGVNVVLSSQVAAMNSLNNMAMEMNETEMHEVADIIASHPRIGNQYLRSYGVGFGGPGLERCIDYLSDAARGQKLIDESVLFKQLIKVNESTKRRFVRRIKLGMGGTNGKIIAVLGFTYKSWTNSVVNSPAIQICLELIKEEGATINIYDPILVQEDIQRITEFSNYQTKIQLVYDVYQACHGVDAICILTAWEHFLNLDFAHIFVHMRNQHNANIFYGRWMDTNPQNLNPHPLRQLGFRVFGIPSD